MRDTAAHANRKLWVIFPVLAFATVHPMATKAQAVADQPIVEAALRQLMGSAIGGLLRTSRGICVAYEDNGKRQLAPELLQRLSGDSIPLYGPQACHLDQQRRSLVTASGEAAVRLSATPPRRVGADSAEIGVGWYAGMASGEISTCWLGKQQNHWIVRSCRVRVML